MWMNTGRCLQGFASHKCSEGLSNSSEKVRMQRNGMDIHKFVKVLQAFYCVDSIKCFACIGNVNE